MGPSLVFLLVLCASRQTEALELKKINYTNIDNAVIIWEVRPASKDPSLRDRAKTMMCGEPQLRSLRRYIRDCIPNNKYPANLLRCTVCGEKVLFQCWRRDDGLLSWYPVFKTAEDLCSDTVTIPPPISQCPAPKDTPYKCRNEEQTGLKGDIIDCGCKSNCRNVKIECRNDRKWHIWDASKSDLCSTSIMNNPKQTLQISFSNQAYSYSCAPGYHLVGGASTRICRNGVLDGSEPSCELEEFTDLITETVSTTISDIDSTTISDIESTTISEIESKSFTEIKPTKNFEIESTTITEIKSTTINNGTSEGEQSTMYIIVLCTALPLFLIIPALVIFIVYLNKSRNNSQITSNAQENVAANEPAIPENRPLNLPRPINVPRPFGPIAGPSSRVGPRVHAEPENLEMLEGPPEYEVINEQRESNIYDTPGVLL